MLPARRHRHHCTSARGHRARTRRADGAPADHLRMRMHRSMKVGIPKVRQFDVRGVLVATILVTTYAPIARAQTPSPAQPSTTTPAAKPAQPTDPIRLNQIGFRPEAPKVAVVVGGTPTSFSVVTS